MKNVFLFFFTISLSVNLRAQTIYLEEIEVSESGEASELIEPATFLINNSADTVSFVWQRIVQDYPASWMVQFCDKNLCYSDATGSAAFTLAPSEFGLLKPVFGPNDVEGTGTLKVRVYSTSQVTFEDTVTFNATTTGWIGIDEVNASVITIYPTLANDQITVSSSLSLIQIFNSLGNLVLSKSQVGVLETVNISSLENGIYFIRAVDSRNESMITKKLIKVSR